MPSQSFRYSVGPGGPGRTAVPAHPVRLTSPMFGLGPLAVGIGAAVLLRLLVDYEIVGPFQRLAQGTEFALVWVLPVLLGALVSLPRTFWVEIDSSAVRVRRVLGITRTYAPAQLADWGFEQGPGTWGTTPPVATQRRVHFILRTADGYEFERMISTSKAQRISTFLLRARSSGAPW